MNTESYEILKSMHDRFQQQLEMLEGRIEENNRILGTQEQEPKTEEENNKLIEIREELLNKMNGLGQILQREREADFALLTTQEKDRQRIARDLHDISLQNIAYLLHKIELSSMYMDEDPIRAKLELSIVNKKLREVMEEIRSIIFDLRPMTFDDLGMKSALERLADNLNENKTYEMDIAIEEITCQNNIVLVTIYRTVQECLTNIRRHAEATKISFHSKLEKNQYCISIADNGKGFDKDSLQQHGKNHFGISLMKERIRAIGGNITIHTACNEGTTIEITVPILDEGN